MNETNSTARPSSSLIVYPKTLNHVAVSVQKIEVVN
jgi:hypothetical protein